MKRIAKKNYDRFLANKFDHLDEINFLKTVNY